MDAGLALETRFMCRGARGLADQGPNWLQREAIERLELDYDHVQVGNWFVATGAVYATGWRNGRPRCRFRVDDDGRCVAERIWA